MKMSSEEKGPDRILPAENYWTSRRDGCVKIRDAKNILEPKSLVTFFKTKCEEAGDHPALAVKRDGVWQKWSHRKYLHDIKSAAKAFIQLGLEPFHGVAIWGFNSPEWFVADVGAIFAGGMALGLYPTNSIAVNKFILQDSCANIIVVEDIKNVQKILEIKNELPHLKKIIQYSEKPYPHDDVMSWADLISLGENQGDEILDKRQEGMAINQCATLVYTSGTTGMPKGVMLSHDNIYWCAMSATKLGKMRDSSEVIISYLPLSHVAANLMDIWISITGKATVYFADKMALKGTLLNTLREARPTIFMGVPRVWEKIMEGMLEKGKSITGLKRKLADAAKKAGLEHHLNGKDDLMYKIGKRIVYKAVKEALGLDRCRMFFSGAAPNADETVKYFLSVDITLLELYGMSESTGPHSMSFYGGNYRLGSVGKPHIGHKTRIDDPKENGEGEILMWGRNLMIGYLNREDAIGQELTEDGWLRSGDLGMIDQDGFLYVTGRLKELIITAGGENVAPVPIEDAVKRELPCISNAILIGDRKKFLTMFLTFKVDLDERTELPTNKLTKAAIEWCHSIGVENVQTVEDILSAPNPKVMAAIQDGIDRANSVSISNAARVQRWTILPTDMSVESGELGPTLKLKRFVFTEKYKNAIENLYSY